MKSPPQGWPRISASLFYEDAHAAIDWLCNAFGFEIRLKVEGDDGGIEHSELELPNDGLIMVGQAGRREERPWCKSPKSTDGANTQCLAVCVDDADAHCADARKAGAKIVMEPETHDYGDDYWADRTYEAVDPEGHHWWFMQRVHTTGQKHGDAS